jgi:hypothetical protein
VTARRFAGATALAASLLLPAASSACPACAGNPDGGITRYLLIGLMVISPYIAATVVIRFIRKGEAAMRAPEDANVHRG